MHNISKINLGRTLMLLLALLISINGAITKKLLDTFPQWEVIFFNAVTCLIVSVILILVKGVNHFKVKNIPKHFIRVFSMACAFIIYVFSIQKFFILEVMAIYNFAPVLSTILAIFFLKEKFNISRFIAVLLGFVGVLFVIEPGKSFFTLMSFIPILGAFFVAIAYVTTRSIMKIDNVYATVFYYSLGLLILSLFFFPKDFVLPSLGFFLLLSIAGFLSVASHYLFALSVKYGEVSSVAPLEYTAFVWTGLLGYFLLNEIPSLTIILGGTIIIISGIYLIRVEKNLI
jgi:drug/metabolite transporter (DMT)-like permease